MQSVSTPSVEGQSPPVTREVLDYELARIASFLWSIPEDVLQAYPGDIRIRTGRGFFKPRTV
jgi:hypothetical protein